jgi:hypothetical protein
MPTDTGDLMEKVYDLFSGIYASTSGSGAFLAFEKLGVPVTPGMFKLTPTDTALSPALAVQRLSEIGNAVLEVDGNSLRRSNRTVDAMAELMLTQAMPVTPEAMASLGSAKTIASQAFDATLGSLDGMFRFHPVYGSPKDWYDPEAKDNWTLHTVGERDAPPTTTTSAPQPRPVQLNRPTWGIVPIKMQSTLSQPISRTHPIFAVMAESRQVRVAENVSASPALGSIHPQMMVMSRPQVASIAGGVTISPLAMRNVAMAEPTTLAPSPSLGACPAGGVHNHQGSGDYTLVLNAPGAHGQNNWRWCNKCQGLAFAGASSPGACPAGGVHDHEGSGDYTLAMNVPGALGQSNWRWCNKCQGLAFAGSTSPGACPAGGVHDHQGSGDYILVGNAPGAPGQNNWRWCNKCQGLAFAGTLDIKTAGPLVMADVTAQLHATTTAQPVATNSMDISFEHCIVTLTRPWWPEVFLMVRNWFVPGYPRAAFSNAKGDGDLGLLPVLASGFVAIRNLKISTQWSDDDLAAMQKSASFGPFSLVGREFNAGTGTLSCPGIQIVGWFCEALPILPPASDPTMAEPQGTTPSTLADAGTKSGEPQT